MRDTCLGETVIRGGFSRLAHALAHRPLDNRIYTPSDMVLLLAIEGNIGVGKSTLLNKLKEHYAANPRVAFVDEPVDIWESRGLLSAMYENRLSRCSFQIMALATRFSPVLRALSTSAELIITERSIYSDRACFAKVNLMPGSTDHTAYAVAHDALCAALPEEIRRGTILLDAPRAALAERIAKRGRAAENAEADEKSDGESEAAVGVPDAYLADLDEAHAAYFESCDPSARYLIDASSAPDVVFAKVLRAIEHIEGATKPMASQADNKENEPPSPVAPSPTSIMCQATWIGEAESPPGSPPSKPDLGMVSPSNR